MMKLECLVSNPFRKQMSHQDYIDLRSLIKKNSHKLVSVIAPKPAKKLQYILYINTFYKCILFFIHNTFYIYNAIHFIFYYDGIRSIKLILDEGD